MCKMIKVENAPQALTMNTVYCMKHTYLVFMTFRKLALIPFYCSWLSLLQKCFVPVLKLVTMAETESGV
jgi:hypothetical protein